MRKSSSSLFYLFFLIICAQNNIISQGIDDAEVIKKEVWPGYETGGGAYYIAYSPYRTGFSTVTSYISLPTSLNTNNGKRNAYISFGVLGISGFIDMGIMNDGAGWKPFYCLNKQFQSFPEYIGIKNVKIVGIEIEVLQSRNIIFSLSFRDSGLKILKSFRTVIDGRNILEYENNKVKLRFYRFASLVNTYYPDNQNDQTYMINGIFTNLVIVVNGAGYSWGIAGDYIETSWKVSTKRIEFGYADDHESFSIKHYQY